MRTFRQGFLFGLGLLAALGVAGLFLVAFTVVGLAIFQAGG